MKCKHILAEPNFSFQKILTMNKIKYILFFSKNLTENFSEDNFVSIIRSELWLKSVSSLSQFEGYFIKLVWLTFFMMTVFVIVWTLQNSSMFNMLSIVTQRLRLHFKSINNFVKKRVHNNRMKNWIEQ